MSAVKPIPNGYHTVTPYFMVTDANKQIEFMAAAFGATERVRVHREDQSIMHAEVQIGDSRIMMGEAYGDHKAMPCAIFLYVEKCDDVYAQALNAGGVSLMEPTNMDEAGCRYGGVEDPLGNRWWIGTQYADV